MTAEMGRCRDCISWKPNRFSGSVTGQMVCMSIAGVGYDGDVDEGENTYAYCEDSFGNPVLFVTASDFGCVMFMGKSRA